MWIIREAENEITLIGVPVRTIAFGVIIFVSMVSFGSSFLPSIFAGKTSDLWFFGIGISLLIIIAAYLLFGTKIIITKINEKTEQFTVSTYGILNRRNRKINFNQLSGLIEFESDSSSDGVRGFELFLPLDSGEKIGLGSLPTMWRDNAVNAKEQANKYLKVTSEKYKQDENDFKLTIFDD
jgi:hypothetical protein